MEEELQKVMGSHCVGVEDLLIREYQMGTPPTHTNTVMGAVSNEVLCEGQAFLLALSQFSVPGERGREG